MENFKYFELDDLVQVQPEKLLLKKEDKDVFNILIINHELCKKYFYLVSTNNEEIGFEKE